jgi:drug/metabolite transporter (DMT)-like permease
MGILATIAQILMTKAYGYSKAGMISTVSYSTVAFSAIFGFFIGEALPNFNMSIGILLVILSATLIAKK